MIYTKKQLKERFEYYIGLNLAHFKVLSRKYLEYKLELMGLEYNEIQHIETASDPQIPEIMRSKFKVDDIDIVIKQSIYQDEPGKPCVLGECEECHETNERPFNTVFELMNAIFILSSHDLHKGAKPS